MGPACHDDGMGEEDGWAAVVLTGGTASRLGGADKSALARDGSRLLDLALDAVAGATETVVVGPEVTTPRPVTFTREEPAGGGPLAGVSAGVAALRGDPDLVVVLAVDMPHVTAATVARLVGAAHGTAGAWLVDGAGRRQLAGAIRRDLVPLTAAAGGLPMRVLMQHAGCVDVVAAPGEADDVDTWDDASRLGIRRDTSRRT
jgi:molybdopterin-guanine dinucleotide biosynthesis protein A